MYEFFVENQKDIMLALCAVCVGCAVLLAITSFLDRRKKRILILMQLVSTVLLYSDRATYIYMGDTSELGIIMSRVSNFLVFFLTAGIIYVFNIYLSYLLIHECGARDIPNCLKIVNVATMAEMLLVIISQFTNLYYYFDENNIYHRGSGFFICYIIPVICPLIQFTVVRKNKEKLSKWIYTSLLLYIFLPLLTSAVQFVVYGIAMVNMSLALVSISFFICTYIDINKTVIDSHHTEMRLLENEKKNARLLFDQTTRAFMAAVEQRDEYTKEKAPKVAHLCRRIAAMMGKSEEECNDVYYAALLHNIGLVSIPDNILEKQGEYTPEERKLIEQVPVLSSEILSNIAAFPMLTEAALCSHERYDGSGYPLKLSGESIPEVARIIGAVDVYNAMISPRSYRSALPMQTVREEFVTQAGIKYDPVVASMLIKIIDQEKELGNLQTAKVEKEIVCDTYRDKISVGIPILREFTSISFKVDNTIEGEDVFNGPSLILFDSLDEYVHDSKKSISEYHYVEYGEVWFDGKVISTAAQNVKVEFISDSHRLGGNIQEHCYGIRAARFEDHIKLELSSAKGIVNIIYAIGDVAAAVYLGITGENCRIYDIEANVGEEQIHEWDIPRIVDSENYIDRMESDLPNIQINQYRSESTMGIPLNNKIKLDFHTMSMPSAELVWQCPFIVLYSSDDKRIDSDSYKEYALIKINGEVIANEKLVENKFSMKKNERFPGWDAWKEINKVGLECSVTISKKGNKVGIYTENLGIAIENITTILDDTKEVYVALSGEQVALTDIRIG